MKESMPSPDAITQKSRDSSFEPPLLYSQYSVLPESVEIEKVIEVKVVAIIEVVTVIPVIHVIIVVRCRLINYSQKCRPAVDQTAPVTCYTSGRFRKKEENLCLEQSSEIL